jgi:hypothetical protein
MKNLFAIIGLLVVLFIGVGIWQGWFKFAVNSDNKAVVEADLKKAGDDIKKGIEVGKDKFEGAMKKDTPPTGTTTGSGTPAATPGPLK